jgi:hypothetical protein
MDAQYLYQSAKRLTYPHQASNVMVAEEPPSAALAVRAEGVDAGLRRQDEVAPSKSRF